MAPKTWPFDPILIVDDDAAVLGIQEDLLSMEGINHVVCVSSGRSALDYLGRNPVELVVLDLSLPDLGGRDLLELMRRESPDVPVVIVTATSDLPTAIACMKLGAFDYLVKPVEPVRFASSIQRGLEFRDLRRGYIGLRDQLLAPSVVDAQAFSGIITSNGQMLRLFQFAESLASFREPVLITGETGVGKDLFANALHRASRVPGAFVPVNTGGVDDLLFSDTLFGHRKGAFTGAVEPREGMVAKAKEGTLFLDEIGELDPTSQVKLLRLIENREYQPLGSDRFFTADARIVLATHQDLKRRCEEGSFRKDLYYRISTYEIKVPPLRHRPEDIAPLFSAFLDRASAEVGWDQLQCDPQVFGLLSSYPFPGNVRELRSVAYRCVGLLRSMGVRRLSAEMLTSMDPFQEASVPRPSEPPPLAFGPVLPTMKAIQSSLVQEALRRTNGNQARAAELIGMTPQGLNNRLKRSRGSSH